MEQYEKEIEKWMSSLHQKQRRTAKWPATNVLKRTWHEWKLYFECFGYYLWHYCKFRKMKMNFKSFHYQMEYFTLVDPQIKHIKSLWNGMEEIQNETSKQQEERKTDRAITQELSKKRPPKE